MDVVTLSGMENKEIVQTNRRAIANTTMTALFAALTAAGAFISIPLPFSPVPVALQNLFALLAGLILGPFRGGAAVALFLIAGALGAPVFAGAVGGFAHFFGPTGGFLLGYLLAALTAGLIAGRPRGNRRSSRPRLILAVLAGLLAVYVPGLLWLKIVLDTDALTALAIGFVPFVFGDILKGIAAVLIAPRLRRAAAEQADG
ncbi:MAG: biotin transporter BioY [Spirochaetaceae bacterium]|jgi:biotin transport system substrate-specific component|nr:biotin transporter BioY [Spirochaetaceae bacterium]